MDDGGGRPRYAIESVDSALRMLVMLRRDGRLSVSAAARELGVARSTAHRLISMLRYHEFAVQAADRSYRPGPMLHGLAPRPSSHLAALVEPHLRRLSSQVGETTNLMVLRGADVLFVQSAETDQVLRVGSRRGVRLPARSTSGGRVLLAELEVDRIVALHPEVESDPHALDSLLSMLVTVRRQGFGTNYEESEHGVTALGVAIRGPRGRTEAAISIAAPTARYRKRQVLSLLPALQHAAVAIEADYTAQSSSKRAGSASRTSLE